MLKTLTFITFPIWFFPLLALSLVLITVYELTGWKPCHDVRY